MLEKSLESPLDCKEIKPVDPKGNQSWIFIGRTGAEAEAPIFWPPDMKSWLTGEDSNTGKDWRQKEKRVTEDEMFGWHHWLNGHKFEQTLGDSEWQRNLVCATVQGVSKIQMWLSDWTTTTFGQHMAHLDKQLTFETPVYLLGLTSSLLMLCIQMLNSYITDFLHLSYSFLPRPQNFMNITHWLPHPEKLLIRFQCNGLLKQAVLTGQTLA